jgi:hypothetical protein
MFYAEIEIESADGYSLKIDYMKDGIVSSGFQAN